MKTSPPKDTLSSIRWRGFRALAASLFIPGMMASGAVTVDLNSAADFAVLAGSGITINGATTVTGDIGSFPTASITGLENLTLNGVNHAGDATTQAAKTDLLAAYLDASGRIPTTTYDPIFDLGGLTLLPGVYNDPSSFGLTGTLTLDAQGDPDAVWIFQAGTTLITGANSFVDLIDGAQARNVFWQVGTSATLGTDTDFAGSILASESITVATGASVDGGLYALNGAVTLDSNNVVVPEPGSMLLIAAGVASMFSLRRRSRVV